LRKRAGPAPQKALCGTPKRRAITTIREAHHDRVGHAGHDMRQRQAGILHWSPKPRVIDGLHTERVQLPPIHILVGLGGNQGQFQAVRRAQVDKEYRIHTALVPVTERGRSAESRYTKERPMVCEALKDPGIHNPVRVRVTCDVDTGAKSPTAPQEAPHMKAQTKNRQRLSCVLCNPLNNRQKSEKPETKRQARPGL